MTTSGSGPSVLPRLPGTTIPPVHSDKILQCTGQICRAIPSKKRVGGEDGEAQWKYGLDCFSDSELDSESDEGKNYRCKHKYEILF